MAAKAPPARGGCYWGNLYRAVYRKVAGESEAIFAAVYILIFQIFFQFVSFSVRISVHWATSFFDGKMRISGTSFKFFA